MSQHVGLVFVLVPADSRTTESDAGARSNHFINTLLMAHVIYLLNSYVWIHTYICMYVPTYIEVRRDEEPPPSSVQIDLIFPRQCNFRSRFQNFLGGFLNGCCDIIFQVISLSTSRDLPRTL